MNTIFSDVTNVLGVPFRVALIPATNANRPGTTQGRKLDGGVYAKSTVHETANPDRGANAEMHRVFVFGGGGSEGVSFHAVVDDHEIIQLLPLDEVAWHAGDGAHGPGNSTAIATETCINSDGDWQKTLDNLAKWQAFLIQNGALTIEDVVQHNHWSGKDCPHVLRSTPGGWDALVSKIGEYVRSLTMPDPQPNRRYFPETGQEIHDAFKAQWETLEKIKNATGTSNVAMDLVGYPITPELREVLGDGNEYTVQYFQRARFEWHPERNPGLVMLGLVGAELQACRQDADHDCACEEPKA